MLSAYTHQQATFRSVKNKKISNSTIKRYIDYLCDSFLIDSAIRYDVKRKKYLDTLVKYYFTDMGLRNARLNFRQIEETHSMENIIFNELKMRGAMWMWVLSCSTAPMKRGTASASSWRLTSSATKVPAERKQSRHLRRFIYFIGKGKNCQQIQQ